MLRLHVAFPEGRWPDGNLQVEVAERLLDRLEDCKRAFPVAGVLGGSGGAVLQRLKSGRAGIERVLYLDSSRDMLARVRKQQQVSLAELLLTPNCIDLSANNIAHDQSAGKKKDGRTVKGGVKTADLAAPVLCGLCKRMLRRVEHPFPTSHTFKERRKHCLFKSTA